MIFWSFLFYFFFSVSPVLSAFQAFLCYSACLTLIPFSLDKDLPTGIYCLHHYLCYTTSFTSLGIGFFLSTRDEMGPVRSGF